MNKKIIFLLQRCKLLKKDEQFYQKRIENLRNKIIKETPWLAGASHYGSVTHRLPFSEQAKYYYEYKNMIVMRRAQYAIIFLTITLLLMTGVELYFKLFL